MRCSLCRRRAFTLIEMLVALALTAVLAGSLYMSLHISLGARKRIRAAVVPVRSAATALDLVQRDLYSALPPTGILAGAFIGTDDQAAVGGADGDSMEFYALADARGGDGIRKIEFALVLSEDATDNTLVRRVTENLLAPETPEPTEEILSRNVTSLNFRYFDGTVWTDTWDSGAVDNILPAVVEAIIALRPEASDKGESETYKLTRVLMLPCAAAPDASGTSSGSGTGSQRQSR